MSRAQQLNKIELMLERLDAAFVVREPGNARSAEAFDGLRKQIIQSGKNHRSHVAHLLSLADDIEKGASVSFIKNRLGDFLNELGIERSSDTSRIDFFDVVEGDGPSLECIEPAVIERIDGGHLVLQRAGKARRIPSRVVEVAPTPEPTEPKAEQAQSDADAQPPKRGGWFGRRTRKSGAEATLEADEPTPSMTIQPEPTNENGEDDGRSRN